MPVPLAEPRCPFAREPSSSAAVQSANPYVLSAAICERAGPLLANWCEEYMLFLCMWMRFFCQG